LHARQISEGRWANRNDKIGVAVNEVESYDWELKNAYKNRLTDDEIELLKKRRNDEIAKLDSKYTQRVLNGNYEYP
jgi:hypothetical protein